MKLKNEVVVGIVVLLSIAVVLVGAFWLSGKPWSEEQVEVVAAFREVGELREGNPVAYRGVNVGRVTSIELAPTSRFVLVTMKVSPTIILPEQPGVVLAPASLFGDWQAQLVSIEGFPDLEFVRAPEPGVLPGTSLPDISQLTAVAARIASDVETLTERVEVAFTEQTAIKIRETIENVQEISEQLTGFVEQQTVVYAEVSENVLLATENVQEATAEVRSVVGQVEQAVDAGELEAIIRNVRLTTENLQELTAELDTITDQVPGLLGQFQVTLQAATDIIEQLEPAAAEVGPTLAEARAALATLRRVTEGVEAGEGTLGRLLADPALYEETQAALTTLRRILAEIEEDPVKYIREVDVKVDVF